MKGARINRRVVVIAFLLAVLVGAGGQAVALWSQSSTVTMDVHTGNLPAPTITCSPVTGHKIQVHWAADGQLSAFDVEVTQNGNARSDIQPTGTSLVIKFNADSVQSEDVWTVAVTGRNSQGWETDTATYQFVTVGQANKAELKCAEF